MGGVDVGAAGRPGVWGVGCVVGWVWGGTREGGKEKAGELVIVMILSVVMLWAR